MVDDIFFLTVHEVLGAIEGFILSPDLKPLIALRKAEFERDKKQPDRTERFIVDGAYVAGLEKTESHSLEPLSGDVQMGTGCSSGEVTATARVISDPRTQSLERGDILVAHHTDPGWICLLYTSPSPRD